MSEGSDAVWQYEADRPDGIRLGLSLSGGGIRSATFALGAYQRLVEAGIFARLRYLSAVSGGSYIASGLAISHSFIDNQQAAGPAPPWSRGSPEEARLRRNLNYLAPGGSGRLWLSANLLYGLILNLTPLLLGAFLCGRIAGMVLDTLHPGIGSSAGLDPTALTLTVLAGVGLVLGSALVVGLRRFGDKDRMRRRLGRSRSERIVTVLMGSAGGLVLLGAALPAVVNLLSQQASSALAADLGIDDFSSTAQRLALGFIGVTLGLAIGGAAVWLLQRRRLPVLRGILAGTSGLLVLLVPFVMAAETATVRHWDLGDDVPVTLATVATILIFAIFAHNRRYSMHLFYRERIQEAFAFTRVDGPGGPTAESVPYSQPILLSEVADRNASTGLFPELVVCAAVAARGAEVPNKARAASFTFEGLRCGNRRLGLQGPTKEVEEGDWIGGGDLTLPSMMAISGAAVSPLMGRFTLPAFRFLMAMLNVRLGVWIRPPGAPTRKALEPTRNWLVRAWRYVLRGWREPGAWYVLKEALGLAGASGRYVYVSDGGHWENLGLVELLRRRCTHVMVVDASADPDLGDIGRAISVARAELGVEISLDPRGTLRGDDEPPMTPVAVGTFRYPDGTAGDIYYARSVMWKSAPSDLHLFAARERMFPHHPTANQFLSGELFDAYRALGYAVGDELVSAIRLPPPHFDERTTLQPADAPDPVPETV